MIGVKPQGRLGNQMFQYAFAYAQAKKLNTSFFIAENSPPYHIFTLHNYFLLRENEEKINKKKQWWMKHLFKKLPSYKELYQIGNDDIESKKNESTSKNVLWDAYCQSENYFSPYQDDIINLFQVKKEHKNKFDQKYNTLFSQRKILVIHVRRTDYIDWGGETLGGKNMTLPMSYYTNCLNLITDLESYHVIVLSDDIEYTKTAFEEYPNFHYESNNEIVDFQVMTNADKLILSNSTYAWWAAFLNQKKDTMIYGPKFWLGFKINSEYPLGIMSSKFEWIDVN